MVLVSYCGPQPGELSEGYFIRELDEEIDKVAKYPQPLSMDSAHYSGHPFPSVRGKWHCWCPLFDPRLVWKVGELSVGDEVQRKVPAMGDQETIWFRQT